MAKRQEMVSGPNRAETGTRRRAGLRRGDEGSSLVSFAMTLPILLGFTFGVMQVCLGYYSYEEISEAAREGTRYAAVRGSTCETSAGASCTVTAAEVQTYVSGLGWPNLGGGTMTVTATYPDGDEVPGHRVRVATAYVFPYKIPFMTTHALSMSSTSQMYILQ